MQIEPSKQMENTVMIEQEHDGMWCDEFSEPMNDLDFFSEQPDLVVDTDDKKP